MMPVARVVAAGGFANETHDLVNDYARAPPILVETAQSSVPILRATLPQPLNQRMLAYAARTGSQHSRK
jgi:hypothetical protein